MDFSKSLLRLNTIKKNDVTILITLMPFSGIHAAEGYQSRIQNWIVENYHASMPAKNIKFVSMAINEEQPLELLNSIIDDTDIFTTATAKPVVTKPIQGSHG